MQNHGTVPKQDTTRQTLEFGAALCKQAPHLTPDQMQFWISNQKMLQQVLASALVIPDWHRLWACFYKEVWGIENDFLQLELPKKQRGFNWFILMMKSLDREIIFAKGAERKIFEEDPLASRKLFSDRYALPKSYGVWIRDGVEADAENRDRSASYSLDEALSGKSRAITFEEYAVFYIFYNWLTGKFLDQKGWTICAGSKTYPAYDHDDVPCCHTVAGKMKIIYCGFRACRPDRSFRSVID
ncbi:MAG: hypothetical protein NTX82_04545 [Candidatus Parcubacteria bacterium]|nr:hypothetical protein [Candidatus Parcubacteria bacterium]